MPCKGTCQIEQHQWREDRIDGNPYNGAPYIIPGSDREAVPLGQSDAEIWDGEDLSRYTEYKLFLNVGYSSQWTSGVDRQYPRHGRALNCTEENCVCDYDLDNPTVVEDWPKKWTRYQVFVPHVWRQSNDNDPTKEFVTRMLLKGAILHRKRVIQGLCKDNPNLVVVPPFEKLPELEDH